MGSVRFFTEDISFKLEKPRNRTAWIKRVVERERSILGEINYIFCSDKYLLRLNQQYLNHNTYTDIITFDLSPDKTLTGDIYISIDRVYENATLLNIPEQDELDRVMIHGVLHLIGYSDKNLAEKAKMRKKEEACLSLR